MSNPKTPSNTLSQFLPSSPHQSFQCFFRTRPPARSLGLLAESLAIQLAVVAGHIMFARHIEHPIGVGGALMLESLTQALRHLAFVVPAGLGVQEAGLIMFGHALGISGELALAVSMAKRLRELLCALPALISWQWMEVRRLRRPLSGSMGDA